MKSIASYIDHTLLKADATVEEIENLVNEAKKYQFASVCVNPTWVSYCANLLENTDVKVCTVIGFPLGATTPEVKRQETINAIENGAEEVDMVINISALKSGKTDLVKRDIEAVVEAAKGKALVKVIIETCLLTDQEKIQACKLAVEAGCDYVKTSTGFSHGGATVEDIRLMRATVGPDIGVKASGGVQTYEDAMKMIEAGATRIGASSGVKIVEEEQARKNN